MMKPINRKSTRYIFQWFFVVFLANVTSTLFAQTYDIVFDIDKVLLWRDYEKPEHVDFLPEQVVWERSFPSRKGETTETYHIDADLGPVIQRLLTIPGVRISFYSAHHAERAEKVFPHVLLPDGRSLDEIAYKMLGYKDISKAANQDPEGPLGFFASRNGQKKDLRKVVDRDPETGERNIENAILVDDNSGNTFPGQEGNLLPLLEDIPRRPLLVALGLIESSITVAKKRGVGLASVVHERVFQRNGEKVLPHPNLFSQTYLKAGAFLIKGLGNTRFKPQILKPKIVPVRRPVYSWSDAERREAEVRTDRPAEEDRPPSPPSPVVEPGVEAEPGQPLPPPEKRRSFFGSCYGIARNFFALFGRS